MNHKAPVFTPFTPEQIAEHKAWRAAGSPITPTPTIGEVFSWVAKMYP